MWASPDVAGPVPRWTWRSRAAQRRAGCFGWTHRRNDFEFHGRFLVNAREAERRLQGSSVPRPRPRPRASGAGAARLPESPTELMGGCLPLQTPGALDEAAALGAVDELQRSVSGASSPGVASRRMALPFQGSKGKVCAGAGGSERKPAPIEFERRLYAVITLPTRPLIPNDGHVWDIERGERRRRRPSSAIDAPSSTHSAAHPRRRGPPEFVSVASGRRGAGHPLRRAGRHLPNVGRRRCCGAAGADGPFRC